MTGENAERLRAAYYTERGLQALEARLKELVLLYGKEQAYPATFRMTGFPPLIVHSKAHLEGMIDGLAQVLALNKDDLQVVVGDR